MGSKAVKTDLDANLMANLICEEVLKEYKYGEELGDVLMTSANKNLREIDSMQEFSINLLKQIEQNKFTVVEPKKAKVLSIEDKLADINKGIALDISKPLHDMFDQMSEYICDALAG